MLGKIIEKIQEHQNHVIDIALYHKGVYETDSLIQMPRCQNSYSLSKSMTSLAIGAARDKGLLSLDDPILKYLSASLPATYDEKLNRVTIRHLLTMTMGCDSGYLFEGDRYSYSNQDWVNHILSQPLAHEPGTRFVYSNSCYYLLSVIIHRVTGMTLHDFLRMHLYNPLGIHSYAWETCPMGETMGATGLYMATEDILKVGVLCLRRGFHNGMRLISEEYLSEATVNQVEGIKDAPAYGYGFWMLKKGYEGNGAHGQFMKVFPSYDLVAAAHSYDDHVDLTAMIMDVLEESVDREEI